MVVDKIGKLVQERDLRLILHNPQIDCHLHFLRKETLVDDGIGQLELVGGGELEQVHGLLLILHNHQIDFHLRKKTLGSVGDEIGQLGLVVDKIAKSAQKRDLRLILHNHQIDYHLHVLHRRETIGSDGDEMGQVLNERERELAQLLKILRSPTLSPTMTSR